MSSNSILRIVLNQLTFRRNLSLLNRLDLGHSSSLELLKCLGTKKPPRNKLLGRLSKCCHCSTYMLTFQVSEYLVTHLTSVNWKMEVPVKQIWKCEIVTLRDTVLITSSRSGHHPQILKGLSCCSLKCNTFFFLHYLKIPGHT